jgi:hypothetical protein
MKVKLLLGEVSAWAGMTVHEKKLLLVEVPTCVGMTPAKRDKKRRGKGSFASLKMTLPRRHSLFCPACVIPAKAGI